MTTDVYTLAMARRQDRRAARREAGICCAIGAVIGAALVAIWICAGCLS